MESVLKNSRGTVVVEGAVVLPVLCLVFSGLLLVHNVLVEKLRLLQRARNCVWSVANTGCKDGASRDCQQLSVADATNGKTLDGGEDTWETQGLEQLSRGHASAGVEAVAAYLGGLLGIGRGVEVNGKRFITMPAMLGGGTTPVRCHFRVLCNESDPSPIDIFSGSVCAMTGGHVGC